MHEIDASLRRLGVDHVDLYQIHRWDYATPIEETLEALHDVVKAGKARYIGASSMYAWQFAKALAISEREGWTRFVSMQNYVSFSTVREEARNAAALRVRASASFRGVRLARGRLTRDWDETSARGNRRIRQDPLSQDGEADRKVVERVAEVAAARGVPRAQIALAWVMAKPVVTAPIVGATKLQHLDDAVAALSTSNCRRMKPRGWKSRMSRMASRDLPEANDLLMRWSGRDRWRTFG